MFSDALSLCHIFNHAKTISSNTVNPVRIHPGTHYKTTTGDMLSDCAQQYLFSYIIQQTCENN